MDQLRLITLQSGCRRGHYVGVDARWAWGCEDEDNLIFLKFHLRKFRHNFPAPRIRRIPSAAGTCKSNTL